FEARLDRDLVLLVLEEQAERALHEVRIELAFAEQDERAGPVEGLADGGRLAEVHLAQLADERDEVRGERAIDPRDDELQDGELARGSGVVEERVQAPP